jgi:RNA polymerase sigma-70 factor (ECF subfamily)
MSSPSVPPASSAQPDPEIVRLVERARGGDRSAFGSLYARFTRAVHGVVMARAPRGDVDDIVQDVFLVAMQRLSSLHEPAAFAGWLMVIARNRATDHVRRMPLTAEMPELVAPDTGDRTEAIAVLDAIRSLPATYAETLTLRLVEGLTGPEIAASTGLTEGSVRVNLHRGMKQLRAKLEGRTA